MTRDELPTWHRLGFSADPTMQSFCHTAAHPKPIDADPPHLLTLHHEPRRCFFRSGRSKGVIHSG